MDMPSMKGQTHFFDGVFFYTSGAYKQKWYYYNYEFSDYIADNGGYMGLLLGCSLLSFYDGFKCVCEKMLTIFKEKLERHPPHAY